MPFDLETLKRFRPFAGQSPEAAEPPAPISASTAATISSPPSSHPAVLCCADVEQRSVAWLWQDRLALGSLAVLSGEPGSGKTWVALAIAAALSKGDEPGETASNSSPAQAPCSTLYLSPHRSGSELIRSRFLRLSGDPARLFLLHTHASAGDPQASRLQQMSVLENAIQSTRARLLIIDPLHSYLAAGSRHRAHETARLFDELAHLAEKHSCSILLIRHLRRRGRGATSVELSAAVHTEFLVGSSPDARDFSAIVPIKSNLGPPAQSLGYLIAPEGELAFHWTGPSTLTAEDLQTDRPKGPGLPQRKLAGDWLRRQLAQGPLSQGTIEGAALRDGLHIMTLRRAKHDIGAFSTKRSDGAWYWDLLVPPAQSNLSPSTCPSG
jgi:hypothetical protein